MVTDCCFLVGNFDELLLPTGCFISVNNNINTEVPPNVCDQSVKGMTTGSLNLSAYAGTDIYKGCPGRASVQILWQRKYDCDADEVYFIFSGEGRSSMYGDFPAVSLNKLITTAEILTASSQSGPASLFTKVTQQEGYGMTYNGGPINFDTSIHSSCEQSNMGLGVGPYYLQNFNIELVPGSIPVANYTFAYNV
jgi:hypothetical protein